MGRNVVLESKEPTIEITKKSQIGDGARSGQDP
jgi:hypothetical protein